jgi:acyl carrier protein
MMADRKQLEANLIQFVRARGSRHASVTSQTDLLESGLVDSLLLVDLIFHVEETCSVRFESDQVNPSNFRTIEDIVSFVQNQTSMP